MSRLRALIQKHFGSVVMGFVLVGFVVLLAELLLTGHTRDIQLVAVVATVIGALLALAALLWGHRARMALAVLFLLLSITGLVGVFEHAEEGGGRAEAFVPGTQARALSQASAPIQVRFSYDEESGERSESGFVRREGSPPPLAPLSLTGLSLLGAAAVFAGRESADQEATD